MHSAQTLINHVAIVLDASYSMKEHERTVTKVVDKQIQDLNELSKQHNQETRISVYHFGGAVGRQPATIECLIFDMDVARIPSANGLYKVLRENTALIDAFMKSQEDLETTSTLYGDHAFLTFVLTDGLENASKNPSFAMKRALNNAPENWSVGFLVPDQHSIRQLEQFGALKDQIAVWDTSSAEGLLEAGRKMTDATSNFFVGRASGVRGTRATFGTGIQNVNKRSVVTNLAPLKATEFVMLTNDEHRYQIRDFVQDTLGYYVRGNAFYKLTKKETIQSTKQIIVVEKSSGKAYTGQNARDLVGLPNKNVDVRPDHNPAYDIYVQSTSVNRRVDKNDKVLVLK